MVLSTCPRSSSSGAVRALLGPQLCASCACMRKKRCGLCTERVHCEVKCGSSPRGKALPQAARRCHGAKLGPAPVRRRCSSNPGLVGTRRPCSSTAQFGNPLSPLTDPRLITTPDQIDRLEALFWASPCLISPSLLLGWLGFQVRLLRAPDISTPTQH